MARHTIQFTPIYELDSGLVARTKINEFVAKLLEGGSGIYVLWETLDNLSESVQQNKEEADAKFEQIAEQFEQAKEYTDNAVAEGVAPYVREVHIGDGPAILPDHGILILPESGGGGGGSENVIPYVDLDEEDEEDLTRVPSAYGVKIIKGQINVEELDEFVPENPYLRGDLIKVTDSTGVARGYRCKESHTSGSSFMAGKWERLTFKTLARPLHVLEEEMKAILVME